MFVKRWSRPAERIQRESAAFAAQWMAALASDSDAGLDALPGSDSDESVGAAKALDVLDALVASARPSDNSDRTHVARKVKAALEKRKKEKAGKQEALAALAKPHGRSDGPEYASFTLIDSEKNQCDDCARCQLWKIQSCLRYSPVRPEGPYP